MKPHKGRIRHKMAVRSAHISTKIYASIGFCLVLLLMVSGITVWQLKKISLEIEDIASREILLTERLTQITVHQLEQAYTLLPKFEAEEKDLDIQLVKMLGELEGFAERSVRNVERHEEFTIQLLMALTRDVHTSQL